MNYVALLCSGRNKAVVTQSNEMPLLASEVELLRTESATTDCFVVRIVERVDH